MTRLRVLAFLPLGWFLLALTVGLLHSDSPPPAVIRPEPRAQTEPVPDKGDAADDPAIWLHPTDPDRSLLLGTNKQGGLIVYDLDGKALQTVSPKALPNNVDVIYDVPLAGKRVDLAVASCRGKGSYGVKAWRIDPDSRTLDDVTAGGVLKVFPGREVYGICIYHSRKTGKPYFFVTEKGGGVDQYEIKEADGTITAERVRGFELGSQPEGCVADDELGWLYVGEENVGVWKIGAEPDAGKKPTRVTRVGANGLVQDVEGLTLYCAADGKGYLIVSSQGNNTFKVYTREGDNAFVTTIDPKPGKFGKPRDTDGIAVINRPFGKMFPRGVLVVQDGNAANQEERRQNFKLYAWEDIAGDNLVIDPTWPARTK